jgi:nicastrin
MYDGLVGASCFRRLNSTHQTGCSSTFSGSVGVLHLIRGADDINFVLNNPPSPPYAVVMPTNLFNRENVLQLKDSKFVSAIVVIETNETLNSFSHESKCPNQFMSYTKYPTCDIRNPNTTWNPFGTGLLLEDFQIPIYYLYSRNETQKVIDCFEKFNNHDYKSQNERSLCSVQIKTFMSAATNSEICVRRTNSNRNMAQTKYCDPLQGRNVYGTLFPRKTVNSVERTVDAKERFILVSTRIDTTSMFDGFGLGAMDSLTSFATLVATAHYLRQITLELDNMANKNVLFLLFNGESYDFIGSQRLVYDMKTGNFPDKDYYNLINFTNIDMMIDMGTFDNPNKIVIYHAEELKENEAILKFIKNFNYYNQKFNLSIESSEQKTVNLPPTSAQSFLTADRSFPALILNSADKTNRFYHSIFDDAENLGYNYKNTSLDFNELDELDRVPKIDQLSIQMKIRNVSTLIGMSLYQTISGKEYTGNKLASSVLIDEFLYCYLNTSDCVLFEATMKPNGFHGNPWAPNRYVSVISQAGETAGWAYRVFGYVLSTVVADRDKDNCTTLPYFYLAGSKFKGECRFTTQNLSIAMSPAFIIDDYDFKSNRYSTWTESTWSELSARIFLKPSAFHESLTFSIGFCVLIVSFIFVFLVTSRSDVLFEDTTSQHVAFNPPPQAVVT